MSTTTKEIAEDLTDVIDEINDTISNLDTLAKNVMDLKDEAINTSIAKSKELLENALKHLENIELHYGINN